MTLPPLDFTDEEIVILMAALDYFHRDMEHEELTAGGEPVTTEEVDALFAKLQRMLDY